MMQPRSAIAQIVANFAADAHLEAHALKVGVRELSLSSSLTARGFYERLGCRAIPREEHDGVSTFFMTKMMLVSHTTTS